MTKTTHYKWTLVDSSKRIAKLEAFNFSLATESQEQQERIAELEIENSEYKAHIDILGETPKKTLAEIKASAIEEAVSEILIYKTSNTALIHAAELLEYAQKLRE